LKILHITASYKPAYIYGGPIASVSMLCECLAELEVLRQAQDDIAKDNWMTKKVKLNVEVLTTTANGQNELDVKVGEAKLVDGVLVTYFKRLTKDHSHFSPGLLWRLSKVLRHFDKLSAGLAEHDKLVIHIHAWWNLVSMLSCLIAKWYKVPVILSPRGMLNNYSKGHKNRIAKALLHFFMGKKLLEYCHLHLTSEKEQIDLDSVLKHRNTTVIPNLVNLNFISPTQDSKKNRSTSEQIFKLLLFSRIDKIKGIDLLFEALSAINFDYHLTIAGSGDENYINSLKLKAESLKLDDRINWLGQVSNDDKFSVMAAHDLLVLPSYNENFANVVIESLSVGTPVLVSKNVGLADYVQANALGWVCDLKPLDVAEKITEAYQAVEKREKINSIAPALIRNDFNDAILAKRYMELYEAVLQQAQHDMI